MYFETYCDFNFYTGRTAFQNFTRECLTRCIHHLYAREDKYVLSRDSVKYQLLSFERYRTGEEVRTLL